jgi:hypothetical protein
MSLPLLVLVAAMAQPARVTVNLWNDLADDITVTAPGAARAAVAHYKDADFTAPGDAKSLTVSFKGCDYSLALPGPLADFREGGEGPVRFYLSDQVQLYIVPPDLISQTPPAFLDPRQPNQFPIDPKKTCKAPKL